MVFQGEHVEKHGIASVDDRCRRDGGISFLFIENKSPISKVYGGRCLSNAAFLVCHSNYPGLAGSSWVRHCEYS